MFLRWHRGSVCHLKVKMTSVCNVIGQIALFYHHTVIFIKYLWKSIMYVDFTFHISGVPQVSNNRKSILLNDS